MAEMFGFSCGIIGNCKFLCFRDSSARRIRMGRYPFASNLHRSLLDSLETRFRLRILGLIPRSGVLSHWYRKGGFSVAPAFGRTGVVIL